jgi:hypothetical protein
MRGIKMRKVYSSATCNRHPAPITLEERTPAVRAIRVDIGANERFQPVLLAIIQDNQKQRC